MFTTFLERPIQSFDVAHSEKAWGQVTGTDGIHASISCTIISRPKERQPIPPKAQAFVWLLISVAGWTHGSKLVAQF